MTSRWWFYPALAVLALPLLPILLLVFAAIITYPTLPTLETLTDYRPKMPLRVFSAEGTLIGEFGEERRELVKIEDVPELMKKAILAAEDDRFYEHGGVDYIGVLRAAYSNFTSGGVRQGASTITMQVARNFFLSKEKTLSRKFNEMLLSFKIEHNLSKDEILQLYVNHIYLGQRSYGFASAAQVYFAKPLNQVTLAEMAMLAGLPKAPAAFNPVVNPARAKVRQMYILRRMHDLGYITKEQFELAQNEPITTRQSNRHQEFAVNANYVAEMARQEMYDRFQDDAYTQGYSVYTTIRAQDQAVAYASVRKGVMEYDHRHGYRGPEGYVDLKKISSDDQLDEALEDVPDSGDLIPAVVQLINPKGITVHCKGGQVVEIRGEGLHFAQQTLGDKLALNHRIRVGSLLRVYKNDKDFWEITQLPQIEAAFVSANPRDGAIYALVGGFDFYNNQFNHVTQAWRQPGSSFKPFIYSAALEKGFTPASVINDAPLVIDLSQTGEELWQPKNFDGEFAGPMRLRQGLTRSKNLVSIRILQAIGLGYAHDYVTKFGFDKDKIKPFLTMALGAGEVTPMQLMTGYSVFANGGYRIMPYFIQRVEDGQGKLVSQAAAVVAGQGAEQVIDVRNAFTMVNMMQDVVKHGTAMRAMELGRQDLAGKTGTTTDSRDAWFAGFHPTLVAITWIGYDNPQSLGEKETGGGAALPIWMGYMDKMLKGVPEVEYTVPEHVITTRINDEGIHDPNGNRIEYFYEENPPPEQGEIITEDNKPGTTNDQLF
jgi:penicillin-binding protein 1A